MKTGLHVLLLRVLTVGSKFALTLYLAKVLPAEDLGSYAIMITTISIGVYALGMEFYVFNARQIPTLDSIGQCLCIINQTVFHVGIYLLLLPLSVLLFTFNVLPLQSFAWFYTILVTEHVNQEGYRLLIAMSRPIAANIVLFIRSGLWILVLIAYHEILGVETTLHNVWIFWILGSLFGVLSIVVLISNMPWRKALPVQIQWKWIYSGIKVSWMYSCNIVLYSITTYSSRYFLQASNGEEAVGVFFFFVSVSNVVLTFVEAGGYSVLQPKLIALHHKSDYEEFHVVYKQLCGTILVSAILISLLLYLGLIPILHYFNKSVFLREFNLMVPLLFAGIFNSLALAPHIIIFVRKMDLTILIVQLTGTCVALVSNYMLIYSKGIVGAAYSTVLIAGFLAALKGIVAVTMAKGTRSI